MCHLGGEVAVDRGGIDQLHGDQLSSGVETLIRSGRRLSAGDESERLDFEQRMADDQAARDALARAVDLTQTVVAAEQQVVTSSRQLGRLRRTAVAAVSIAACLTLVLLFQWMPQSENAPLASDEQTSDSSVEVAFAWMSTLSESVFDGDMDLNEGELLLSEDESDSVLSSWDDTLDDDGTTTPSWMLAAVTGIDRSTSDTLDSDPLGEN